VTEALEPALDRVKPMLFWPFNLAKCIRIGFGPWLAGLGESGGSGGFSGCNHGGNHHFSGNNAGEQLRHFYYWAQYGAQYTVFPIPSAPPPLPLPPPNDSV